MGYDQLEDRRVLAGIEFAPLSGVVTITGSEVHDFAFVNQLSAVEIEVRLAGFPVHQFQVSQVNEIYFHGLDGDDYFINNTAIPSWAWGGNGNDMLIGGSGNDTLYGDDGDDRLDGRDGDDVLFGGSGNDTLRGGNGDDSIFGDDGDDRILGGEGNDTLYGQAGNDTVLGGPGNDTISGGGGDDILHGGTGNDRIVGGGGDDLIFGGLGDDELIGNDGNDTIYGGPGNDLIRGGEGDDLLYGDAGDDIIYGMEGNDFIDGGVGDDILYGGAGDDLIYGRDGNDRLYGGPGGDKLYGGAGNDGLFGGIDNQNELYGGPGNDRFLVVGNQAVAGIQVRNDAVIQFRHRTSNWTNLEIQVVDEALHLMHARTGSTRVLKGTVTSEPLIFIKDATMLADRRFASALVTRTESKLNLVTGQVETKEFVEHQVTMSEWNETDSVDNLDVVAEVVREVGYNWASDEWMRSVSIKLAGIYPQFANLSNWTNTLPDLNVITNYYQSTDNQWWYVRTASMTENYARKNPQADFTSAFKFYFDSRVTDAQRMQYQEKMELFDEFFAKLALL